MTYAPYGIPAVQSGITRGVVRLVYYLSVCATISIVVVEDAYPALNFTVLSMRAVDEMSFIQYHYYDTVSIDSQHSLIDRQYPPHLK